MTDRVEVLEVASPKSQTYVDPPVELLVNVAATGEHPAGALNVNDATGFGKTVTLIVFVSLQPAVVVAVKLTVYILLELRVFVNTSDGLVMVDVFPFPKFHV